MNQELDDECSLHEPPRGFGQERPEDAQIEYFTKGEKLVLYFVLAAFCAMCLWGAWTFLKDFWHGLVWLVTQ